MARGLNANCQSPVGTGPFIVKGWMHGQEIDLVRNPNYNSAPANAKHQGPAYAERAHLEVPRGSLGAVRGPAERRRRSMIFNPPPQDNTALSLRLALTSSTSFTPGLPNGIALNTTRPPFNDLQGATGVPVCLQRPGRRQERRTSGCCRRQSGAVGAGDARLRPDVRAHLRPQHRQGQPAAGRSRLEAQKQPGLPHQGRQGS